MDCTTRLLGESCVPTYFTIFVFKNQNFLARRKIVLGRDKVALLDCLCANVSCVVVATIHHGALLGIE